MTIQDIRLIFLKAVQRYAYDTNVNPNRCGGVKSFCSVLSLSEITDLDASNAKKVYNDFLSGLFWSRDWYFQGADANKLKREFPSFVFTKNNTTVENQSFACHSFEVAILQPEDCKDCGSCNRPTEVIQDDAEKTLRQIMLYVSTFEQFYVYELNKPTRTVWDTEEYLTRQVELNKIESFVATGKTIHSNYDFSQRLVINPFDRFTEMGLRGATTQLTFCGCSIEQGSFSDNVPIPAFVGNSVCVTC